MWIDTDPEFLITVTMELTQSVGSCMRSITSRRSIRSNSSLTFDLMVTGTFQGGYITGL